MTLYSLAALDEAPPSQVTLALLAEAIRDGAVPASRRVLATADSRNPDEGLALLDAYVRIADLRVRQAILDTVLAISASDPYRRTRSSTAPESGDPAA